MTVIALAGGSASIGAVYADATTVYAPPYQQQDSGIITDIINCNTPRELYLKNSETPVCITASTYDTLVERGWILSPYQSYLRIIYTLEGSEEDKVQLAIDETIKMSEVENVPLSHTLQIIL